MDTATRLEALIDAAAPYMARDRAEELSRNVYLGLEELDRERATGMDRWLYVYDSIRRRVSHFGLRVINAGGCAGRMVGAWDLCASKAQESRSGG